MSTHNLEFPGSGVSGPAFRANLRDFALAVASNNYSSADPPTMLPGMMQVTPSNVLRIRNAANTGWVTLMPNVSLPNGGLDTGSIFNTNVVANQDLTVQGTTYANGFLDVATTSAFRGRATFTDSIVVSGSSTSTFNSPLAVGTFSSTGSFTVGGVAQFNSNVNISGSLTIPTAILGSNDSRAATTAFVANAINATPTNKRSVVEVSPANGAIRAVNHTLAEEPTMAWVQIRLLTAYPTYSVGDLISGDIRGLVARFNSSECIANISASGVAIVRGDGVNSLMTLASNDYMIRFTVFA